MLSLEKFDVFFDSLRQALNHCQYEFGGKYPFTKDAQYALGKNGYGTMTEFMAEFQRWLFNADKERLEPYIISVYENITRYGVFFVELAESYERRFVGNDGRATLDITKYDDLMKSESYRIVQSYAVAIGHLADQMRDQAFKYAKVVLKPFRELNLDSYNIHGNFMPELRSVISEPTNIDVSEVDKIVVLDEEKRQQILSILAPLGGTNPKKEIIMAREDFERLILYTEHLVLSDNIPTEILPIAKTEISIEHIRYTFYRLHKELFGRSQIHDSFIEFIHVVFKKFANISRSTTKAKFSTAPNSYEKDFTG